jgi:preprotein translocase subunit YajC
VLDEAAAKSYLADPSHFFGALLMFLFQDIPAGGPAPAVAPGAAPAVQGTQTATVGVPAPAAQQQGSNFMFQIIPMIAIFGVFMYMSSRKQKKEQDARKALSKGDKVVSQSGLIGEIVEMDERIAKVKLAPGITVQMLASSISAAPATESQLADLKEAKASADKK